MFSIFYEQRLRLQRRGRVISLCYLLCALAVFCASLLPLEGGPALARTANAPQDLFRASPLSYLAGPRVWKTLHCQSPQSQIHCYGPAQMRNAYNVQPLIDRGITGAGSSIVLIDAYDAPHITHDLALFNQHFSLPAAPLNIFKPDGVPTFDAQNKSQVDWSSETTLDVEWAHAIAPGATLQLVLAKSGSDADLLRAVQFAVKQDLGDVISMSFGENELCLDASEIPAWHEAFYEATLKRMTLFSSSGDNGASAVSCDQEQVLRAVSTPANDPLVTAVGGTYLDANIATGAYRSEVVWNDASSHSASGGGFSQLMPRPYYQADIAQPGLSRAVPDVSYDAALNTGVLITWSDGNGGPDAPYVNGGTSAGAPQWAGLAALAAQLRGRRLGLINPALYTLGSSSLYPTLFHDITKGDNAVTLTNKAHQAVSPGGEKAASGWDAATGWGSPKAETLLPALVDTLNQHEAEYDAQLVTLR